MTIRTRDDEDAPQHDAAAPLDALAPEERLIRTWVECTRSDRVDLSGLLRLTPGESDR